MADLTIQKLTADEYHDLVDCIQQGNRIELDEYLEDHAPDNLTTLGQVLLEFFQFHQARMKEHAAMLQALTSIGRFGTPDGDPATFVIVEPELAKRYSGDMKAVQKLLRSMPPLTVGSRVRHTQDKSLGTLISIDCGKPVVRWDSNRGSGTPVTGRMDSWDRIEFAE
jgi:hypothetical protein